MGADRRFEPEPLCPEKIKSQIFGMNDDLLIYLYQTIDSTNDEAKRRILNGAGHGTVIIAEAQTGGRGRHGRYFFSPARTGLYLSMILQPDLTMEESFLITIAAAVATAEAIETLTDCQIGIKWVNDLIYQDKKIGGILTEACGDGSKGNIGTVIVGIGLNVATKDEVIPEDLRPIVGSLKTEGLSRNLLAAQLISRMMVYCQKKSMAMILDQYRAKSILQGKEIHYWKNQKIFSGWVMGINELGHLLVKTSQGTMDCLSTGEISVKIK